MKEASGTLSAIASTIYGINNAKNLFSGTDLVLLMRKLCYILHLSSQASLVTDVVFFDNLQKHVRGETNSGGGSDGRFSFPSDIQAQAAILDGLLDSSGLSSLKRVPVTYKKEDGWYPITFGTGDDVSIFGYFQSPIIQELYKIAENDPGSESEIQTIVSNLVEQVSELFSLRIRDYHAQRVRHILSHDKLTDLYIRSVLVPRIQAQMSFLNNSQGNYAILMIDYDHFKHINDENSHSVGDQVLMQAGVIMREIEEGWYKEVLQGPPRDIDRWQMGRYGGEELMIFIPGGTPEQVRDFAEKLCKSVYELQLSNRGIRLNNNRKISVSIGIAFGGSGAIVQEFDSLVDLADEAVYNAKLRGRNQVAIYHDGIPSENADLRNRLQEAIPKHKQNKRTERRKK